MSSVQDARVHPPVCGDLIVATWRWQAFDMQSNLLSGMENLILVELNVKRPTHRQVQVSCGRRCMYVLLEEVSLLWHRLK